MDAGEPDVGEGNQEMALPSETPQLMEEEVRPGTRVWFITRSISVHGWKRLSGMVPPRALSVLSKRKRRR